MAIDDDNDDIDDDDETEFYPFSWTADPRSAAVIDLLPGFNMSHEMFTMIEKRVDSPFIFFVRRALIAVQRPPWCVFDSDYRLGGSLA